MVASLGPVFLPILHSYATALCTWSPTLASGKSDVYQQYSVVLEECYLYSCSLPLIHVVKKSNPYGKLK